MIELLIKVNDNNHINDPEIDRTAVWKRGYVVAAKIVTTASNIITNWGNKEGLPNWVILNISNATNVTLYDQLLTEWKRQLEYEIVASQGIPDGVRLKISATNISGNDQGVEGGKVTQSNIENYLNNWNVGNIIFADNSVTFDVNIYNAIISNGFWQQNPANIIFNEINYDEINNIHTITAEYPAGLNPSVVYSIVADKVEAVNIISNANNIITFYAGRPQVRDAFKRDVRRKWEKNIYLRRAYLDTAQVQTIVNAGGFMQITQAQFLNNVQIINRVI